MSGNPYLLDTPARIAFSGGRTSGYMLWHVLQAFGGGLPADVLVTFANTGREAEETLEFVERCNAEWGVPIVWLEYARTDAPAVKAKGKQQVIGCHGFRVVDFLTANRTGQPFEDIIGAKADYRAEAKDETPILPNPTDRWCSSELKARTMDRYMQSLGHTEYDVIVGLRADEPSRVRSLKAVSTRKLEYVCPLAQAGVVEKDVLAFWKTQPFDLKLRHDPDLGTYEGNCDLCFLKSLKKKRRLLQERPEAFDWWAEMERRTGATFRRDHPTYQQFADMRVPLEMCDKDDDLGTCLCTD